MPKTSPPPNREKQPRQRDRDKGFDWLSGKVINADRPLGQGVPDRPWKDGLAIFRRRRKGGTQTYADIARFDAALELNASTVFVYAEAARYETLPLDVEADLRRLPDLSDRQLKKAIRLLTRFGSIQAHRRAVADRVARDVVAKRLVAELARLLRIRHALETGLQDATLAHEQEARFVENNIDDNCRPGQAVLLRTFLHPSLSVSPEASVREIDTALSKKTAFRSSSDVTVGALTLMAFHAQFNPATIYADYLYLEDLLDLAVYTGAHAMGFSEPLHAVDIVTYQRMLCENGEDPETDPHLRRERADLAAALRVVWRQIPGLVEAARRYGDLPKPEIRAGAGSLDQQNP